MDQPPLSQRRIFRFFLPLAVSWIFMAIEAPVSIGVISRLEDATTHTAAFLLMMGLALWIESPVIDLLSTSTTLSKDNQSFGAMTRFTLWLMAWVTFAHFLFVFTPLYDVLAYRVMQVPPEVGQSARLGLMIMLPWSALIGWRRYLQGILIRNAETRMIGFGTGIRVATMLAFAFGLYLGSDLPGIAIAATALVFSVGAEAVFIHFASRRVIEEAGLQRTSEAGTSLSNRKLLEFHLPLTATTMVMLLSGPLVTSALTRTEDAVTTMAAFQVATTILFLFRTTTFATPEVVITLSRESKGPEALWKFCLGLGGLLTSLLLLFAATPLDDLLFHRVLGADPIVARQASFILLLGSFMPLIGALQGYCRGMLTAHHLTVSRMVAVLASIAVLGMLLTIGVHQQWSGLVIAPMAITVSLVAELGVLALSWHRGKSRLATQSAVG